MRRLVVFMERLLPRMPDLLLTGTVTALILAWFAAHLPHDGQERAYRSDRLVFQAVPVQPPGTAGTVILYTALLGQQVSALPPKGRSSATGFLDYVPKQVMVQGVKERVAATIAVSKSDLERVREAVFETTKGTVKTEEISISQTMTARLTGSSSLQIQDVSTPEQLILPGEATVWNWDVIPTVDGPAQLYLVLSVHSRSSDGFPAAKDLPPFIRTINVQINPAFKIQNFFQDNLALIVGLLSIGTALAKIPWLKVWTWTHGLPRSVSWWIRISLPVWIGRRRRGLVEHWKRFRTR
jgi:hypothetical protein